MTPPPSQSARDAGVKLIVRCVGCGHEWDASEACDVPMCPKCFSPGVAVEAKR